jgi:predicted TIM-barrel fold metal-dependent hydrolase
MASTSTSPRADDDGPANASRHLLIDTDVHNYIADITAYLPRVWHDRWTRIGFGVSPVHEGNPRGVQRRDARTPDDGPPASDPVFLVTDHLDRYAIDYAILTGPGGLPLGPDPDYSNAVASAYNDCLLDAWLPVTPRFKGSVIVNADDPEAAAREIRRVGSNPDMVQVVMASASRAPYGQRQYHPIYDAAAEIGLPVAVHPGTEGAELAWPPTPVGYPSRYLEWHNILPITYMAQINSLVCEGVFEKFPSLRFVGIEGGLAWLPHLMWRMDKNYKALRDTTPWLKRLPSEYIVDHVRLTTQPIEEPANPDELAHVLDNDDQPHPAATGPERPRSDPRRHGIRAVRSRCPAGPHDDHAPTRAGTTHRQPGERHRSDRVTVVLYGLSLGS